MPGARGLPRHPEQHARFTSFQTDTNRIESDHAALKRILGDRQSFRSFSSAKATLRGIEAIRTIKNRHIYDMKPGIQGDIALVHEVFGLAA